MCTDCTAGEITWLWCSMPMLIVLMRMAIIIPLLKYLLSTIPQSFTLISSQMSLHFPKQVRFLFGVSSESLSPFSSKRFSSLSVSSSALSSSSPLAECPVSSAPSLSDRAAAHCGHSSGFGVTEREMAFSRGWELLWSNLVSWIQQGAARQTKNSTF